MTLTILPTTLSGLHVVETQTAVDARGTFTRFFCEQELAPLLGTRRIVQINHSRSLETGTVRGMHYQAPPHTDMKWVRCTAGRIWDVALDIRAGSPTFLQWVAAELSAENEKMMLIPEGFAHGFQTLEPNSEVMYFVTHPYVPDANAGIRYDDPAIGITWPLPVTQVSDRDRHHSRLQKAFAGITVAAQ